MMTLSDQQEILGALADVLMEIYAMESAVLRTWKMVQSSGEKSAELTSAMTRVYCESAMDKIIAAAKKVLAASAEGDMLRTSMAIVRRLSKHDPVDTIALRQKIADRVIEAGKYVTA